MSSSDSRNNHSQPSFEHSANSQQTLNPGSRNSSQNNSPFPQPSFFEDAFRPSPSPPSAPYSFLDNILNPIPNPADSSPLPFGYRRTNETALQDLRASMCPPGLSMPRSRPPPSGFVDLTSDQDPPPPQRKRSSPGAGPSAKRRKREHGLSDQARTPKAEADIEEIDLSEDKAPLRDTLEKQRADAVKAQQKPEEKPTTFNTFTCVICMDTPTDMTATSCGHLFCHTCLMEALIAGENRSGPGEPRRSQCPVCRKHIGRTKQADIIPLAMMKRLLEQRRKFSASSKAS